MEHCWGVPPCIQRGTVFASRFMFWEASRDETSLIFFLGVWVSGLALHWDTRLHSVLSPKRECHKLARPALNPRPYSNLNAWFDPVFRRHHCKLVTPAPFFLRCFFKGSLTPIRKHNKAILKRECGIAVSPPMYCWTWFAPSPPRWAFLQDFGTGILVQVFFIFYILVQVFLYRYFCTGIFVQVFLYKYFAQ